MHICNGEYALSMLENVPKDNKVTFYHLTYLRTFDSHSFDKWLYKQHLPFKSCWVTRSRQMLTFNYDHMNYLLVFGQELWKVFLNDNFIYIIFCCGDSSWCVC